MNDRSDAGNFGSWKTDDGGLPAFQWKAPLPVVTLMPDGQPARVPEDPWFLVGNDGLKLFVHATGRLQWLTGVREWARLNSDGSPNAATGDLSVRTGSVTHQITGTSAEAKRLFGAGFASWMHTLPGDLQVEHRMECPPPARSAPRPNRWVERIVLTNRGNRPLQVTVSRSLPLCYVPCTLQRVPRERWPLRHALKAVRQADGSVEVSFTPSPTDGIHEPLEPHISSTLEWHPPKISCAPLRSGDVLIRSASKKSTALITVSAQVFLKPGQTRDLAWCWTAFTSNRPPRLPSPDTVSAWRTQWARAVPDFQDEIDGALHREMRWHTAMLLSLAQWSDAYQCRFFPQGTSYEFDWGLTCSARDHLQHALPFCHLAPWLAADSIRHACRKMTPTGEIRLMENGPFSTTTLFFATSDQQLYFLGLLAEYLSATKHAKLLQEKLAPWPPHAGSRAVTVLEHAERAFRFLRDEVGRGPHGLVRLLNSDWNDGIHWVTSGVPYPEMFMQAESHLNTAQACGVLPHAAKALKSAACRLPPAPAKRARALAARLASYHKLLLPALLADWQGREFLPRARTPAGTLGDRQMWLEPQAFALGIEEVPVKQRRRLLRQMERRLAEPWGLRQQETPAPVPPFQTGGRENGGVWFALMGPAIVHVGSWDRPAAWRLLKNMTLDAHARRFPGYWPGVWTAPDNFESSLLATAGLPDPQGIWSEFPAFCSHAHAWPLFAYLRLRQS